MTPRVSIVGIGDDGLEGLSPVARAAVDAAEVLAGGARHLAMLPEDGRPRIAWGESFRERLDEALAIADRRLCILASGDPMWFGVGNAVARRLPAGAYTVFPHPSSFSLAAARMGWPLQGTVCLSAHGRPLEAVALHLAPGARLLVLAENGETPARLAALLRERAFGPSTVTALEHLGGPEERVVSARADAWTQACADLTVIAVECRPGPGALWHARLAGLPDDAFAHDGQITKREVRAATLALLAPWPGAVLWDIGAGCGSIAVEWMRAGGRATAIERDPARCALIAANAARLGVPDLRVVQGEALAALADLEGTPDAVFIGGGVAEDLLAAAWARLRPGGRLAANAVTAEGEAALLDWQARHGGALSRLAVSRLEPMGKRRAWRPLRPVTLYQGVKP